MPMGVEGLDLLDPRNLARVRTQVWFASQALKGMAVAAGDAEPVMEEALGPVVRLLDLAQVKLSDLIDTTSSRPLSSWKPAGETGSGGPR